MAKETKTIGVKIICAWMFSILFIVGGIGILIDSFISGFLTLIAGILILPPFSKMLEEKANLKITTWLKIIIIFVLLMIAGIFIPSDDVINDNQSSGLRLEGDSNSQDNQQLIEDSSSQIKECVPNWQCSSWPDCSSIGQQKRTCLDSNDCDVLTNKPKESQSCNIPVSKSWHEIKTFSGTGYKTTDTFVITGSKFKLTYAVEEANEWSMLSFFVYPEGETTIYIDSISTTIGFSGTDDSISYAGAGTYYLDVISANLESWEIEVEDYY